MWTAGLVSAAQQKRGADADAVSVRFAFVIGEGCSRSTGNNRKKRKRVLCDGLLDGWMDGWVGGCARRKGESVRTREGVRCKV